MYVRTRVCIVQQFQYSITYVHVHVRIYVHMYVYTCARLSTQRTIPYTPTHLPSIAHVVVRVDPPTEHLALSAVRPHTGPTGDMRPRKQAQPRP